MIVLPVAFYTQLGHGYNLCSQACIAMQAATLTNHKPAHAKAVALQTGTDHGEPVGFADLIRMGAHYGVKLTYYSKADIAWVRRMIDERRPPILLVDYRQFSQRPNKAYIAAHFLLAVGYNETSFILNDPLQTAGHFIVPMSEFEKALNTPSQISGSTNRPNQAVYPSELTVAMTTITGANLDLYHPLNPTADTFVQSGLKAARLEYNVSRAKQFEGIPHGNTDRTAASRFYKPYVTTLRAGGVRVFGCLTHVTFGEGEQHGFVWPVVRENDNEMRRFINMHVSFCEPIIAEYIGLIDDWLIGNENDAKPADARASVSLKSTQYGAWARELSAMIRRVNPRARVWVGEFVGGAGDAIAYLKASGLQPSEYDGISLHPYDMSSLKSYLAAWKQFTKKPLAITEFGPLGSPAEQATWNTDQIFNMIESYTKTAMNAGVEVLAKYSWANTMDNGYGIVDASNQLRRDSRNRTLLDILIQPMITPPIQPPQAVDSPIRLMNIGSGGIRIRESAGLSGKIVGVLHDGQAVEPQLETLQADGYRWRRFIAGGVNGFVAVEGNGIRLTLKP